MLPLSADDAGVLSFDVAGGKVVYAQTGIRNPSDLHVADAGLRKVQRAGAFNDWVKTRRLSLPKKHSFVNGKGRAPAATCWRPSTEPRPRARPTRPASW